MSVPENTNGVPERCPSCNGNVMLMPSAEAGMLEGKCLQCGRVVYEAADPYATDAVARGRGAGQAAREEQRSGSRGKGPSISLSVSANAGALLSRELERRGARRNEVFRLGGSAREASVRLDIGVPSSADVVLDFRGRPVLGVERSAAEEIGDAVVVVRRDNGRPRLSIQHRGRDGGGPGEAAAEDVERSVA